MLKVIITEHTRDTKFIPSSQASDERLGWRNNQILKYIFLILNRFRNSNSHKTIIMSKSSQTFVGQIRGMIFAIKTEALAFPLPNNRWCRQSLCFHCSCKLSVSLDSWLVAEQEILFIFRLLVWEYVSSWCNGDKICETSHNFWVKYPECWCRAKIFT